MSGAQGTLPTALARALAAELIHVSSMLADLALDLGSNGETLRHHMTSLQRIDYVTQMHFAIADLLSNDAPSEADIGSVTLLDMADRLRASIAANEQQSAAA